MKKQWCLGLCIHHWRKNCHIYLLSRGIKEYQTMTINDTNFEFIKVSMDEPLKVWLLSVSEIRKVCFLLVICFIKRILSLIWVFGAGQEKLCMICKQLLII